MKVLAADTGTAINTVAVLEDGRLVAETVVACGRAHSERLLATIDWVLSEAGLELGALDLLAVGKGPGSFTGLRVGIAAFKGLALGAGLPLLGVPSLEALARHGRLRDGLIAPLFDARMGEVFGAVFRYSDGRRECIVPPRVGPIEDVVAGIEEPVLCIGDGADTYTARLLEASPWASIERNVTPRGGYIAAEALALFESGAVADGALVEPVYLRKPQAEENLLKAAP